MNWSEADDARISALRNLTRERELTEAEKRELQALRRNEIREAFDRRRRLFKGGRS